MKIYLLQWLDSDADFIAQRQAFIRKRDARKKHTELFVESISNMDLTVNQNFDEDCKEINVKGKESLVDLINSLV